MINISQVQIIPLIIISIIFLIITCAFYSFSKKSLDFIKRQAKNEEEDEDNEEDDDPNEDVFEERYDNLNHCQINFYFEQGQKNIEDDFKIRNDENKTILNHVAIIAAIFSLFFFLGKQTFKQYDNISLFLVLLATHTAAFFNIIASIWCMFQALSLPYKMPPHLYEIKRKYTELNVDTLKTMFIERFAQNGKINNESNIRKLFLLYHSKNFLKRAFIFLGIAFIILCANKLYDTIIA